MTDNQTPVSTPTPVAAVAVRLPPYWNRNPRVWFLQAESQFHLTHITSQQRMYHHVVSVLSPTAADEVYDVLSNPSTTNPYDQLKAALLQRTEASERTRWRQLLSAEELGDRRPSQLLRRMTQLLGERASTIDDALLRELFLQRLPPNVQMVLAAAAPLNLTGLAGLADAVIEVSTPSTSNIAATTIPPASDAPSTAQNVQIPNASQGYVDQLCQRLEQVVLAATSPVDGTLHRADLKTTARAEATLPVCVTTTGVSVPTRAAANAPAPLYTTHTPKDKQTARSHECSHVANRLPERFVVCCGRFQASGGYNNVEGLPVFLREHSGLQDIAGNHFTNG
ncbi:hypothetical protein HPB47_008947 [Ixodes persulcatus]|uniref:Uncharacterized protein n=1 Tax=Ixodes persulcatus TaxID=34615 RepID=A0AC60P3E6_IXOPE|nr:hypothetical protein HPB47_008947 [Ixodes persulcatus]